MCTQQREIKNKYTGQILYVKCGHCASCLQEKAQHRVSRIKYHDSSTRDCLLVTLTYSRFSCPYILRSDAYDFAHGRLKQIPIYRDLRCRKVRQNSSYHFDYRYRRGNFVLDKIDYKQDVDFSHVKDLKYRRGCVGVVYYPDVQHFVARLRLNLKRNFNYEKFISTYICSEYGTISQRPHFHLLLWCEKGDFEILRNAIVASWPYGHLSRFDRAIEKAFSASSYVASYVNSGSDFPQFFKVYQKPKCSYSKGFGVYNSLFSVDSLLSRFANGRLSFYRQVSCENGFKTVESPIPKYIIYRYFPLYKAYSRVAPTSLCSCTERIYALHSRIATPREKLADSSYINKMVSPLYFSDEDFHKIGVRLSNAYERFKTVSQLDLSFSEYAKLHKQMWSCYHSTCLRLHMENPDVPLNEKYDNLEHVKCCVDAGLRYLPVGFTYDMLHETDPNKFRSVVDRTQRMEQAFHENIKHRKVSNSIMTLQSEVF